MVRILKPAWVCHGREKNGMAKPIFSVDIHPDGKRFATAGADNTIRIWSMAPMLEQSAEDDPAVHKSLATLTGHTRPVNCVRWASRSQLLASASDDHLALLWVLRDSDVHRQQGNLEQKQVENWRLLGRLQGHSHDVTDLAWAPDESKLATCSLDNSIMVWDVSRQDGSHRMALISTLRHTSMVKGIAWDPMGKYISSASDDRSVVIWRCADWQAEQRVEQPYQKEGRTFFRRLSWSPDGVYVATSHGFKDPQHISPVLRRTRDFTIECDFVGHKKAIVSTRFNPVIFKHTTADSGAGASVPKHYTCVAIGSQDKSFSVWIASQVRPILVSQTFFDGSVLDITWGHDGYTLMCCSYDGSIVMFRFEPEELGPSVSEEERERILTSLYGGTSDLSGQAADIPESIEQLQMERGQGAIVSSVAAKAAPAAKAAAADAPAAAQLVQPNALSRQGGAQTAAIGAPTALSNGAAVNILATRPKQASNAPRRFSQMDSSRDANHQPEVRKGGKRRIAPVLISPAKPTGTGHSGNSGNLGGGGNSLPGKRRVDLMSAGGAASLSSSTSSLPMMAAKKMRSDERRSGSNSAFSNGNTASRDGSSSGFQPTVPSSPARPLLVRNRSAPAVVTNAHGSSGPLVREIGISPQTLLIEAAASTASNHGGSSLRREAAAESSCTLTVSGGSGAGQDYCKIRWTDELAAATPSALGGNGNSFVAVGCADGSLYTYTLHGRRLMPCIMLGGGGIAVVEASPNRPELLVITVDGSLRVWHMDDPVSPRQLLKSTIAPLLGGSSAQLCQAMLTSGGVAVVVLTDGSAFAYDNRLCAWLRLGASKLHAQLLDLLCLTHLCCVVLPCCLLSVCSHDWTPTADQTFQNSDFHFDCPPPASGAGALPSGQVGTALATVRAAAASAVSDAGGAPLGRVQALMAAASERTGGAGGVRQQSLAHLEALLGSALMLGRTAAPSSGRGAGQSSTTAAEVAAIAAAQNEYRGWLKVYGRRLAEEAAIAKARELCDSLLGPPHSRRAHGDNQAAESMAKSDEWQPNILDLPKRTLLAELVLPSMAAHSRAPAVQRLAAEYNVELEEIENQRQVASI